MSYPKQTYQPQMQTSLQPPSPPGYEESQTIQASTLQADALGQTSAKNKKALLKYVGMLPALHQCMAWTCFIINCIIPGIGTIIAAFSVLTCCAKHPSVKDRCRIFCINFWFGWLQLITCVLIIGYVWAIMWGWGFIVYSYIGYHGGMDVPEIQQVVVGQKQEEKQKVQENTETLEMTSY